MPRRKIVYRETYREGALKMSADHLPALRHFAEGDAQKFVATECHVLAAGIVEEPDGTRREYQDLRVYVELR